MNVRVAAFGSEQGVPLFMTPPPAVLHGKEEVSFKTYAYYSWYAKCCAVMAPRIYDRGTYQYPKWYSYMAAYVLETPHPQLTAYSTTRSLSVKFV